jgi:WD40 repeat protein
VRLVLLTSIHLREWVTEQWLAVHELCNAGHTKAVLGITQHPSLLNMAVSCGEDRLIKVWSLNDGICQRSILCRSKPVDVAFTGDGQCIVSAHYDGSLHVFDASTGSEMRVVDAVHRKEHGSCVAVVPTAHASRMVSVGRDSALCITDINQGEVRVLRFVVCIVTPIYPCCFSRIAPLQ